MWMRGGLKLRAKIKDIAGFAKPHGDGCRRNALNWPPSIEMLRMAIGLGGSPGCVSIAAVREPHAHGSSLLALKAACQRATARDPLSSCCAWLWAQGVTGQRHEGSSSRSSSAGVQAVSLPSILRMGHIEARQCSALNLGPSIELLCMAMG
jgi:hypothetical protein